MKIIIKGDQGLSREIPFEFGIQVDAFHEIIKNEAAHLKGEMPMDDSDEGDKETFALYRFFTDLQENFEDVANASGYLGSKSFSIGVDGDILEKGVVMTLRIDLHDYTSIDDADWNFDGDYCLVNCVTFDERKDAEDYARNHYRSEVRAWITGDEGSNYLEDKQGVEYPANVYRWVVLPRWDRLATQHHDGDSWPEHLRMQDDVKDPSDNLSAERIYDEARQANPDLFDAWKDLNSDYRDLIEQIVERARVE